MSKMQELYKKVAGDSALQEKFNAIIKDSGKAGEAATKERLTAFANEAGYEISLDEMKAFFTELSDKEKGQLSDAELDMVAGGKSWPFITHSIVTFGVGCATVSLIGAIEQTSCEDVAL